MNTIILYKSIRRTKKTQNSIKSTFKGTFWKKKIYLKTI